MNQSSCRLCLQNKELKQSHIVPKFVFRWLKETSATGYLRFGVNMQMRRQDGLKTPLLCGDCEQRFSAWERTFAETLFQPLCDGNGTKPFDYGPWMTKFATSLAWRSLLYLQSTGPFESFSTDKLPLLDQAVDVWRSFLLDQSGSIMPFTQSYVPLGYISSTTAPNLPPNFNRYLGRSVAVDLVTSSNHSFIYTKLPFAVFIGVIHSDRQQDWSNTNLLANGGHFARDFSVPGEVFGYMTESAKHWSELNEKLSDVQRALVNDAALKSLERTRNSGSVEAMLRDVALFGEDAFESSDPEA